MKLDSLFYTITIDYLSGFNEGEQGQIQNLRVD